MGGSEWSDLPLNRILYIPFSIFSYSSNIFIASHVKFRPGGLYVCTGDLEEFEVFLEHLFIQGPNSRDETDLF